MIGGALALAGVVPGGRIGRGGESVGPAVAYPTVHALPAFPAPAFLSLVAQVHSWGKLFTVLHLKVKQAIYRQGRGRKKRSGNR